MKRLLTFVLVSIYFVSYGQKKLPITFDTYKTWSEEAMGDLSPDGNFAYYTIDSLSIGKSTLTVITTSGRKLLSMENVSEAKFSANSELLFGKLSGDTLVRYELKNNRKVYFTNISSYQLIKIKERELLITSTNDHNLDVRDLNGTIKYSLKNVTEYHISENGEVFIITSPIKSDEEKIELIWLDTKSKQHRTIYSGGPVHNIIFDRTCNQIAFMTQTPDESSIYHYRNGDKSTMMLLNSRNIDEKFNIIAGEWKFSKSSDRIFFGLEEKENARFKKINSNLEIWSYEDAYLRSYWNHKKNVMPRDYLASISIKTKSLVQLTHNDETLVISPSGNNIAVIASHFGDAGQSRRTEL